jgi:hypothetical protein
MKALTLCCLMVACATVPLRAQHLSPEDVRISLDSAVHLARSAAAAAVPSLSSYLPYSVTPRVFKGEPAPSSRPQKSLLVIPDSIRRKVGYQHWKGGAIGGSVGALAGLALSLVAPTQCADCTSTDSDVLEATLIGAGLGGAFGFLVGAASPRYRWEADTADMSGARSE